MSVVYACFYLVIAYFVTATSAKLTVSENKKLLDAHNLYRRQVSPPASDMRLMTWDVSIAFLAQSKADKCVYSHGVKVYHPTYGALGENIYVTSGKLPNSRYGVDRAVFMWNEETNYFTYSSNTCQAGKECNHYTQLNWAKSNKVGCGIKYCSGQVTVPGGKVLTGATLLFCEYSPPGNVESGFLFATSVALPYQTGPSCSACPSDANVCVNKLCATTAEAAATESPATTASTIQITTPKILPGATSQTASSRSFTTSPVTTSPVSLSSFTRSLFISSSLNLSPVITSLFTSSPVTTSSPITLQNKPTLTTSQVTTSAITMSSATASSVTTSSPSTLPTNILPVTIKPTPVTTSRVTTSPVTTSSVLTSAVTTSPVTTSQATTSPVTTSQATTAPVTTSQATTSQSSMMSSTTVPTTSETATTAAVQKTTVAMTTVATSTVAMTSAAVTNASTTAVQPMLKCYVCKATSSNACQKKSKLKKCGPTEGYCLTSVKPYKYELKCATKQTCETKPMTTSSKVTCCTTDFCNRVTFKPGPGGSASFVTSSLGTIVLAIAVALLGAGR